MHTKLNEILPVVHLSAQGLVGLQTSQGKLSITQRSCASANEIMCFLARDLGKICLKRGWTKNGFGC